MVVENRVFENEAEFKAFLKWCDMTNPVRNKRRSEDMETISLNKIICDSNRKYTKDEGFEQLLNSIKAIGIIEPPVVRRTDGGKYRVIAGRRRIAAAQKLNMDKIDCVVRGEDSITDEEIALSENVNRLEMHPLDEAAAFKKMADEGNSIEEIARYYARSASAIYKRLRLASLVEELKGWFRDGILNISGAAVLAELPEEDQKKFYEQNEAHYKDMTPDAIQEEGEIAPQRISNFIYKTQRFKIAACMGDCDTCAKRTHNEDNDLFEEFSHMDDVCLDGDCYRIKWRGLIGDALEAKILQMNKAGIKTDDKIIFFGGVPEQIYKKASRARFEIEKTDVEFEILRDKDYVRTGETNKKNGTCWMIHADYNGKIDAHRIGYKAQPPKEKTEANTGKEIIKEIESYGREAMEAAAEDLQMPSVQVLAQNLKNKNVRSWEFKNEISELVCGRVIGMRIEKESEPGAVRDYLSMFMRKMDEDCYGDYFFDEKKFDETQKEWLRGIFGNGDMRQISAGLSEDAQMMFHFLLLTMDLKNDVPDLDVAKELAAGKKSDNLFWNYAAVSLEEYRALYLAAAKEVAAMVLKPKEKKPSKKKAKESAAPHEEGAAEDSSAAVSSSSSKQKSRPKKSKEDDEEAQDDEDNYPFEMDMDDDDEGEEPNFGGWEE